MVQDVSDNQAGGYIILSNVNGNFSLILYT